MNIEDNIPNINWKNSLTHFASISNVLAGFCVTFIALILRGAIADTNIFYEWTYGQISILLFGISTSFFICASELFLYAKEYDLYDVPNDYLKLYIDDFKLRKEDWSKFEENSDNRCRRYERYGRILYNGAILIIFIGLGIVIAPYNLIVAFIISLFGISLESWQMFEKSRVRKFLIWQRRH